MTVFINDVRADLRSPVILVAWGLLTVMMALAGPFGSYDQVSLPERLIVWLVLTALAIVVAIAMRVIVYSRWGIRDFWRGGGLASALSAVVLTPVFLHLATISGATYLTVPPSAVEIAGFVFCLNMGFCAFRHALEPPSVAALTDEAPVAQPVALPRLAERLAEDMRGPILRISGRDHYVDVTTPQGVSSVLMRFSDALAELEGVDGLQVHRSHWVSAEAVTEGARDGGRPALRLSNGDLVPISRTYLASVVERGWLHHA